MSPSPLEVKSGRTTDAATFRNGASIEIEMRLLYLSLVVLVASGWLLTARPVTGPNPVLAVVSSTYPFAIGRVETKPEAGPVPVVDGDQISSAGAPVMFRLDGENRVVLGGSSQARIRSIGTDGRYFYLSKGSLHFEARKEPLAICALDRLYVPAIPGSGEIVIVGGKADVRLTSGRMIRSGTDACDSKAPPLMLSNLLLSNGMGSGAAATATATATAAGAGITAPAIASVAVATATTAGVAGEVASQIPQSSSPILPSP